MNELYPVRKKQFEGVRFLLIRHSKKNLLKHTVCLNILRTIFNILFKCQKF